MRKLLSLALACNLTVVGATSVVACGAADGPAVGLEVNDQDPGTKATYITNDAYKGQFNGENKLGDDYSYTYKFMADQIGQVALTALNLREKNINTDYSEKQIAFDKDQFLPKGIEGEVLHGNDKHFHDSSWRNFYSDWSNADDSYFTNLRINAEWSNAGDDNPKWQDSDNVPLAVVPFADDLTKNNYFEVPSTVSNYGADDYVTPNKYDITNVQRPNLVTFQPVQDVLNYLNKTKDGNDVSRPYFLSWYNMPQKTDTKDAPGVTQQARHVLVPIGGANGIRLRATFQDKGKTYTFDTQLHNLVARIDVGVYKHSVQISKDESVDYWYQAWYFSGYDYWNAASLNNLVTNSATKPYFNMFKTQDTSQKQGVNFYVGAATDIANPTGDVAQGDKTDNSVFANKSVINNGYSFYEYDMDILPESITPNVDKK